MLPYAGKHHPSGRIIHDKGWFMPMRGQGLSQRKLTEIGDPKLGVRIEIGLDGQRVTSVS